MKNGNQSIVFWNLIFELYKDLLKASSLKYKMLKLLQYKKPRL